MEQNNALYLAIGQLDADTPPLIVVCGNDETLSRDWADVFDPTESDDVNKSELGDLWHGAFVQRLAELLPGADFETESRFEYWNSGHPGRGSHWHLADLPASIEPYREALEEICYQCAAAAENATREAARRDVESTLRCALESTLSEHAAEWIVPDSSTLESTLRSFRAGTFPSEDDAREMLAGLVDGDPAEETTALAVDALKTACNSALVDIELDAENLLAAGPPDPEDTSLTADIAREWGAPRAWYPTVSQLRAAGIDLRLVESVLLIPAGEIDTWGEDAPAGIRVRDGETEFQNAELGGGADWFPLAGRVSAAERRQWFGPGNRYDLAKQIALAALWDPGYDLSHLSIGGMFWLCDAAGLPTHSHGAGPMPRLEKFRADFRQVSV